MVLALLLAIVSHIFLHHLPFSIFTVIGIKLCFSCFNIGQVSREMYNVEGEDRDFQHIPSDLENSNALKNNV